MATSRMSIISEGIPLIHTPPAAASLTGRSRSGFYRLLERGKIPVVKIGPRIFVRDEDVQALITRTPSHRRSARAAA